MTNAISETRVILADDHSIARAGFSLLLKKIPGVTVCAEAANGRELIELACALNPDVIFTDIQMPVLDGLTAISEIRKSAPNIPCVVVSMFESGEAVRRAAKSGAVGYIMKNASAQEFGNAIDSLKYQGSYFSPAVAALLLCREESAPDKILSERQIAIVRLMAKGKSTKEIAFELNVSTKTVDSHRAQLLERLEFNDPARITRYALRHNLLEF